MPHTNHHNAANFHREVRVNRMKCYIHPGVDSVDTCTMCKKPMCAECKLDYDGKILCKPCAMPMVTFLSGMIYGGCDDGPKIGANVSFEEYVPPGSRLIKGLESTVKNRMTRADLTPQENAIRKYILNGMAKEGKPPASADIAKGLRIPSATDVERAIDKLHDADILTKIDDKIISAYPFSIAKTNHMVIFEDGHEVYALCALDALGISSMTGQDTIIQSRCPESGQELKVVIKKGQIVSSQPENIVIYLNGRDTCGRVTDTSCPHINFFRSEEDIYQWMWVNPEFENGDVYLLKDAFEHSKRIFGDMLK